MWGDAKTDPRGHQGVKADLLIQGGEVVFPGQGLCAADVVIQEGKVAAVVKPGLSPKARLLSGGEWAFLLDTSAHCRLWLR